MGLVPLSSFAAHIAGTGAESPCLCVAFLLHQEFRGSIVQNSVSTYQVTIGLQGSSRSNRQPLTSADQHKPTLASFQVLLCCRHQRERRSLLETGLVLANHDSRWGVLRNAEQFIISMQAPLQPSTLQSVQSALNAHGGWLSSYLPDSSVLGIGPEAAADAVRGIPGVLWVVSGHLSVSISKLLLHIQFSVKCC